METRNVNTEINPLLQPWEACDIQLKDENKQITEHFAVVVKQEHDAVAFASVEIIALISPLHLKSERDVVIANFIVTSHNALIEINKNNPTAVAMLLPRLINYYKDCIGELKCYNLSKETVPVLEQATYLLKELAGGQPGQEPVDSGRDTFYSPSEKLLFLILNPPEEYNLTQLIYSCKNMQVFFDSIKGGRAEVRCAPIRKSSRYKGKEVYWTQGIEQHQIPERTFVLSDGWTMQKWLDN